METNTATAPLPDKATAPKDNEVSMMEILSKQCVQINEKISAPGFKKKMKPEDLGLKEGQYDPNLMNLGQLSLFGSQAEDALGFVSRARKNLSDLIAKNSHTVLEAKAIPIQNMDAVLEKVDALIADWDKNVADFVTNYDARRTKAIEEWELQAKLNPEFTEAQAEELIRRVKEAFPPAYEVVKAFKFVYYITHFKAPEQIEIKLTTAAEQRAILEARNKKVVEWEKQYDAEVGGCIKEVTRTIRTMAVNTIDEMVKAIEKGEWNQKTLNRFNGIYDAMKNLTFGGGEITDMDLLSKLKTFEDEYLGVKASEYKKDAEKLSNLTSGLNALKQTTAALAEQDAQEVVDAFKNIGSRKFNIE
jgi:hypothetical protein